MHKLPKRRQPVHGVHNDPKKPTIVFVTACTKGREPRLASAECHDVLRTVWRDATAWMVGRYVVMPDHVHLFAAPGDQDIPLEQWMQYWKSRSAKRMGHGGEQWQRSHWDTRLRSHESYEEKWDYVRENPVRQGLVASADDWPYQGSVFDLTW